MPVRRLTAMLSLGAALLAASSASAAPSLQRVGDFASPLQVAGAPGDYSRLYVLEQEGRIRVVRGGVRLATPFADLTGVVLAGGERGLLSMAFAPDFPSSRLLYVLYTDGQGDIRVDQLRAPSGDRVDPGYRRPVIEVLHREAANHNGGTLQFGRDRNLYVSTGDGGNGYDTPVRDALNTNSLLGKVLRIAPRPGGGYSIPAGNPFVGRSGADQVWAYGLRNPFRFSFDRVTGDLAIGDVGQSAREEVNLALARSGGGRGVNFGWDECEGGLDSEPATTGAPCTYPSTRPVLELSHGAGFCSVIGGHVVRDRSLPSLYGRYLYGDLCLPRLRSVLLRAPHAADDRETSLPVASLTSVSEDTAGCLYATSLDGPVYRIVERSAGVPCPRPSTAAGPTADRTGPRLRHRVPRQQRVLRRRGVIAYTRSSESGTIAISARMRIGRRSYRLRYSRKRARTNRRVVMRARLTRRSSRALRRALRRRGRVIIRVRLRARDRAGNRSRLVRRSVRPRR